MLIYCNQLEITDKYSLNRILDSTIGWIKNKTNRQFTRQELRYSNNYVIQNMKIRTYQADSEYPKLYSILFSQPDTNVRGRQWITEIGIKLEPPLPTVFTILLETSDVSTRVRENPASTRPKLVDYIRTNCTLASTTIGINVKQLLHDDYNLRAFQSELNSPSREYPLVLLSRKFDHQTFVSPEVLQNQLVGLAQVVLCQENFDTWKMERFLSKRYSAWGGAINIIFPMLKHDYCHNSLLLAPALDKLTNQNVNIIHELLSHVTHFTNVRKKTNHFSPYSVRAKRVGDNRKLLHDKLNSLKVDDELATLLEEAIDEMSDIQGKHAESHRVITEELSVEQFRSLELEQLVGEKEDTIRDLRYHLDKRESGEAPIPIIGVSDRSKLFDAVQNPNPENLLQLVASIFSDRVVILQSAFRSAKQSASFLHGSRLANLLFRLCTSYFDDISVGGESVARRVFTSNEFAAKESETVMKSDRYSSLRSFEYKGEILKMYRHLKIGVSDNVQETIRVHFHWLSNEKTIVIGYCGPHLPLGKV